jgi:hypothetical protein
MQDIHCCSCAAWSSGAADFSKWSMKQRARVARTWAWGRWPRAAAGPKRRCAPQAARTRRAAAPRAPARPVQAARAQAPCRAQALRPCRRRLAAGPQSRPSQTRSAVPWASECPRLRNAASPAPCIPGVKPACFINCNEWKGGPSDGGHTPVALGNGGAATPACSATLAAVTASEMAEKVLCALPPAARRMAACTIHHKSDSPATPGQPCTKCHTERSSCNICGLQWRCMEALHATIRSLPELLLPAGRRWAPRPREGASEAVSSEVLMMARSAASLPAACQHVCALLSQWITMQQQHTGQESGSLHGGACVCMSARHVKLQEACACMLAPAGVALWQRLVSALAGEGLSSRRTGEGSTSSKPAAPPTSGPSTPATDTCPPWPIAARGAY